MGRSGSTTAAITAKREAAARPASSSRVTNACRRDFSESSSQVSAMMPLAAAGWPRPEAAPAASTTSAATSVVPSMSRLLATT